MLMKDVSFWCVVLAIVIIFVVHHILSSFKVIEGLDEELPSLVNEDLQTEDEEPETVDPETVDPETVDETVDETVVDGQTELTLSITNHPPAGVQGAEGAGVAGSPVTQSSELLSTPTGVAGAGVVGTEVAGSGVAGAGVASSPVTQPGAQQSGMAQLSTPTVVTTPPTPIVLNLQDMQSNQDLENMPEEPLVDEPIVEGPLQTQDTLTDIDFLKQRAEAMYQAGIMGQKLAHDLQRNQALHEQEMLELEVALEI